MLKPTSKSGSERVRRRLGRLLSTAGPILVVACPAAVLAQVAVNTARVTVGSGTFETVATNNQAVDNDALLAVLAANADNAGPVNGANGAANVLNVLANDSANGTAPTPASVTISVVTPASNPGVSLDVATGAISVAAGVPAGTYTITYQICETANPTNCATATATIVVAAPAIVATNDAPPAVNGTNGGNDVINAFANDTLNGAPVVLSAITATVTSPATPINGGPIPVLDPVTGLVDVPAGTPAGTYSIGYRICENNNPTNCADAVVTIVVSAAPIAATNDTAGPVNGANGAPNIANILTNDALNGAVPTPGNVTISVTRLPATPASRSISPQAMSASRQIGRASCRERVSTIV